MDAAAHTAMPKMQFSYKIRKGHKEIDAWRDTWKKNMNIEKMHGNLEKFFPTSRLNLSYPSSQATGSSLQALNLLFCKISYVNDLLEFFETLSTLYCFLQM